MNDQHNKRPRRNRQEWQALVAEFEAGSLDLQTFCEEQAIKPDRLAFWRRRLKQSPFIELAEPVQQSIPEGAAWDVELTLGQNVTLRLRTH